jgi:hypothetical protein
MTAAKATTGVSANAAPLEQSVTPTRSPFTTIEAAAAA